MNDSLKVCLSFSKFYAFRQHSGYGKAGPHLSFPKYVKATYGIIDIDITNEQFPIEITLEFDCVDNMSMFIMKWC